MSSSTSQKSSRHSILPFFQIGFWDIITGLPAGVLIFMGTVLFTTLTSLSATLNKIPPLVILAIVSSTVGFLAGITRLGKGPATALSAGLIASVILAYLWRSARPGDIFDPLVIGVPGIFITAFFCPLGGWLGAKLRKAL